MTEKYVPGALRRLVFSWSDDFTEIMGLTPTGRATVAVLKLNRVGLIHLRRVLYAFGEYPPVEPLQEA